MSQNRITDEIPVPAEAPMPEAPATCFVDVHIYDYELEPEEPFSVESNPEPEAEITDERDPHPFQSARFPRRYRSLIAVCGSILCVLGVGAYLLLPLLPPFAPQAPILIVPTTHLIRTVYTITVTTGQVTGTQLQGRALVAITRTQARTVPTTGRGHQDARAAHGVITFYNAATSPQTVFAGTLLTGADGEEVVTDADAVLPAGTLATNGQATVPAHALLAGPEGNIPAGTIYGPCCRVNVLAANSAFTGGTSARDYQTVTVHDITTVVSSLKTSVQKSALAALQIQVHRDETLMTLLPCQQNVKPDHQPGEEAAQVRITVSETCRGMTYQTQDVRTRVMQIIVQQVRHQFGDSYRMQRAVQASIQPVPPPGKGQIALQVRCVTLWEYQFSQQQQQNIKAQSAGKQQEDAQQTLMHLPGIQTVRVEGEHIPIDITHIHLVFLVIR